MAPGQRLSADLIDEGQAIPPGRVEAIREGKRSARAAGNSNPWGAHWRTLQIAVAGVAAAMGPMLSLPTSQRRARVLVAP